MAASSAMSGALAATTKKAASMVPAARPSMASSVVHSRAMAVEPVWSMSARAVALVPLPAGTDGQALAGQDGDAVHDLDGTLSREDPEGFVEHLRQRGRPADVGEELGAALDEPDVGVTGAQQLGVLDRAGGLDDLDRDALGREGVLQRAGEARVHAARLSGREREGLGWTTEQQRPPPCPPAAPR